MQFLRKLLGPKVTGKSEESIPSPSAPKDAALLPRTRFSVGWVTDVGVVRSHNEDTALVITAAHDGDGALPPFGLFVLADGMGGHKAGEVASSLAARAAAQSITREFYVPILVDQERDTFQPVLKEVLVNAVRTANDLVAKHVPGGGTTLTCALVLGPRVHIAHVGDSRAYIITEEGTLDQITHDHSLVDRLVELGQLTRDEAAVHPQKNVLYRAVGQGGVLEVDTYIRTVTGNEQILLCSDGLWSMLDEEEIVDIITTTSSPQAACERLVSAANQAGGRDNITAILIEPPVS